MTIRKLAAAAIISLCIFTNEVCFAQLSTSDLSIGGVYLNQNFNKGILHELSFYIDSAAGQVVTIHFDEYYG